VFFKRIGNVFQEYQALYDVFIFGGIDVFAQFVGGFPYCPSSGLCP
jgi:hypothetical protein